MKKIVFLIIACFIIAGFSCRNTKMIIDAPDLPDDKKKPVYEPDEFGPDTETKYVENEFIIKVKDNSYAEMLKKDKDIEAGQPVYSRLTAVKKNTAIKNAIKKRGLDRIYHVRTKKTMNPETFMESYRKKKEIEYIQKNYIYTPDFVPNDTEYAQQYAHALTHIESFWDNQQGSPNIIIAIIGRGIDVNHPDLAENIWINTDEIPGNNLDDDDNGGFIDDIKGWDFDGNDNDPNPDPADTDFYKHESKVAGVAGAIGNNSIGVAGVTWHSKIMAVRVPYTTVGVANGIEYAHMNGAHIINLSLGHNNPLKYGDGVVKTAIDAAYADNIIIIASAGNDMMDINRYPAALYNVIAVGATNTQDKYANFSSLVGSNFGPWVDIAAPGKNVMSTIPGGGYELSNGTSFSAPYISGIAALLLSQNPSLSNLQIRAMIENNVVPIITETDYLSLGRGRINLPIDINQTYPLGEIISPFNKELIPENVQTMEIVMLAVGGKYKLEITPFERTGKMLIKEGIISEEIQQDGFLHVMYQKPKPGAYTLSLEIKTPAYTHIDTKVFGVHGGYQSGWPRPTLGPGRSTKSCPIVMDIDEDGENEIIQSTYGNGGVNGYTYIWNKDGSDINTHWPQPIGGDPSCSTSAVGDIDGDGDYEVVTTTYAYGYLYAWHWQNGQSVSSYWPHSFGNIIRANPVLADMDKDGDSEIIIAVSKAPGDIDNGVYAYQYDGALLWHYQMDGIQGPMAACDFGNDGNVEIIASALGKTVVLNNQGNEIIHWDSGSSRGAVVGDLDHDNTLEIIFSGMINNIDTGTFAYHLDGTKVWGPKGSSSIHYGAFSIGDLNGDNFDEVFISSNDTTNPNNKVYGIMHNGASLAGFPKNTNGMLFQTSPVIGDIDNDGNKEILAACTSGFLYAWESNGDPASGFPRIVTAPIFTTPTLADLDKDGDIEVLLAVENSEYYIYDLPKTYNPANIDWGMYRHDPQCSGLALRAPILTNTDIPTQIEVGQTLTINLAFLNPDNLHLDYYIRQKPQGSTFDGKRLFTWIPTVEQGDTTFTFYLFCTDGIRQDHIPVKIYVKADFATTIKVRLNPDSDESSVKVNEVNPFQIYAMDPDGVKTIKWWISRWNKGTQLYEDISDIHSFNANGVTSKIIQDKINFSAGGIYRLNCRAEDVRNNQNPAKYHTFYVTAN